MKRYLLMLSATIVATAPFMGQALEYGDTTTSSGHHISVEEDFMNDKYPRHVIALTPENSSDADGALVLRCQENRTEAYFVSGPFEFFGRGTLPVVNVRFPDEEIASRFRISLSSDGEAVFFEQPREFIQKLFVNKSVGVSGSYYSGSYRHRFTLDEQTQSAIYDLATTCEWSEKLSPASSEPMPESADQEISQELYSLVEKFGEDRVLSVIEQDFKKSRDLIVK